jgi:hypothetical protein
MKFFCNTDRLHVSLAGSGDPWKALTRVRLGLLRALYDGRTLSDLASVAGKPSDHLRRELDPMIEVQLLHKQGARYTPSFFIADAVETRKVVEHAQQLGQSLAGHLALHWSRLDAKYSELNASQSHSIRDVSFLLVGGQILDIGLLEALKRDRTLLKPAPARPSPDRPEARFYFYMIEGDRSDLGRYGLNDTTLPWPHWYLLTFGQDWVSGTLNSERSTLEETCQELIQTKTTNNPEELAERLRIPIFTETDTTRWSDLVREYSEILLNTYLAEGSNLKRLYSTLRASSYAPHGFSEFFCWYDHVAYAYAIDALEAQGLIAIPPVRFTAALWYASTPMGGCIL